MEETTDQTPTNKGGRPKKELPEKVNQPTGPVAPPGKKLYDKWMGSWVPVETVTNPFDQKTIVITWKFERKGTKANKTNIPLEEAAAKLFNETRRLQAAITPTEQLYPAGSTEDILHELPNPFQSIKL